MTLARGTVVLVELDPTRGHEQRGVRPCIVVSDPAVNVERASIDQGLELFLGLNQVE